ncbi:MAG: PQQ-dependent sugar dehydrogenase [Pseudomonadota bacterium]
MRIAILGVLFSLVLAPLHAQEPPKISLSLLMEGLDAPVFLVAPADGSGRRFVGDQTGAILILDKDGQAGATPFLDLSAKMTPLLQAFDERGLWSLAFHPNFSETGRVFVTYAAKRRDGSPYGGKTAYTWRLSEFQVSESDENRAEPASERVVFEIDWINRKHNGGGLAFGPDGYLYVGLGDGGGVHGVPDVYIAPQLSDDQIKIAGEIQEDPYRLPPEFWSYDDWAQDLTRLHGKILRLDVDAAQPYAIPPTNPFAGTDIGRDEIFAWGFRNPFRLAFDAAGAGDLFVNGVAESLWETIYMVDGPGNYGWAIREGTHCFSRARAFDPPKDCATKGALGEVIRDPVVEYPNWSVKRPWSKIDAEPRGTANVGGFIYRGTALPAFSGKLLFGDFSTQFQVPSGQIFVASPPASWRAMWPFERLIEIDQRIHSLGRDADGELYVLTTAQGIPVGKTGRVWKIVPAGE